MLKAPCNCSRTVLAWAVSAMIAIVQIGCGTSHPSRYDLSQLRDQRARELDQRLSEARPPVENPFSNQSSDE